MSANKRLSILDIQQVVQERVRSCSLCGGAHWELEPDLFALRLANPWAPREGQSVDCAVLICRDCGNMHFLNAEMLARGLPAPSPADSGFPEDED